jgi:hypothetical protein
MLSYRDVVAFAVGAGVAAVIILAAISWRQPQSFDECFLAESRGRSDKVLTVVASYCRNLYP